MTLQAITPAPDWTMDSALPFEESPDGITAEQLWADVYGRIKASVDPSSRQRILGPLKPLELANDVLTLEAPGGFVMDWVEGKLRRKIEEIVSDEIGRPVSLRLVAGRKPEVKVGTVQRVEIRDEPAVRGFVPNPRYTFDHFVMGQSNRYALAGARAVAKAPGGQYNPLYIHGPSGVGKTHLLHAIANELLKGKRDLYLHYTTAQQFVEEFVSALQGNRVEAFRRRHRNVGIWLLDDVQFLAGREKTQEEVFHTFNLLHGTDKQIVLTSDRGPRDLFFDERMQSRFECGLVVDVQLPDTETRTAILLSKAAQENIELDPEIAFYLAMNVPGNIRTLEGALVKLSVYASFEDGGITMATAEKLVERDYRLHIQGKPSIEQIIDVVSRHYSIEAEDIRGPSRKAPIVHARHVSVWLAREVTGDSWKHLGSLFGDRDHSSMMHGYQKMNELQATDAVLRGTLSQLKRTLMPDAP